MPTVPTSPRDVAGNNSDGGSSMSSGFVISEESQRSAESSSTSQGDANLLLPSRASSSGDYRHDSTTTSFGSVILPGNTVRASSKEGGGDRQEVGSGVGSSSESELFDSTGDNATYCEASGGGVDRITQGGEKTTNEGECCYTEATLGGCGRAVHHHHRSCDDYTGGSSVGATTTTEKRGSDAAATSEGSRDDNNDGEAAAVTAESSNTRNDEKIVTTEEEGGDLNREDGEDEVPGMKTHDDDNTGSSSSMTSSTTADAVILGEEGSSPAWCDEGEAAAATTGDTSTLDQTTNCARPNEKAETEEGDLHRDDEDEVGVRTHDIMGSMSSTSATTEDVVNVDHAPSSSSASSSSSSLPAPAMLPPSTRKRGYSPPPPRMMRPTGTASLNHRSTPPRASRRASIVPFTTTSRPNDDATSLSPSKAPRHRRVVGMFKILTGIIIALFVRGRRKLGMWRRRNRNKLVVVVLLPALVASLPLLVFTGTTTTTTYHATTTTATTIPSHASFSAYSASYQKLRPPNSMPIERRGGGILTTHTACRISMWHWYPQEREGRLGRKKDKVCDDLREHGQRVGHHLRDERMADVRHDDTIYIPFTSLERFAYTFLPNVTVDVVVISGHPFNVRPASDDAIRTLLDSPRVVAWFCQNLPKYGGDDPYHVKVHPFPYGLNEKHNKLGLAILPAYKRVLFEGLNRTTFDKKNDVGNDGRNDNNAKSAIAITPPNDVDRPTFVYTGPLTSVHKSDGRDHVPGTEHDRLPPHEYFVRMSRSRYVLSPDGDRPECFRHYEALGLGTVPITELDPILFRHLSGGPVLYGNYEWNATILERVLDARPVVNRNLIREDYWMDWMEDAVGRRLNWNDRLDGEEDGDGDNEDRGKKNNGLTDEENRLLASLGKKNNILTDEENTSLSSSEYPARQRRNIVL